MLIVFERLSGATETVVFGSARSAWCSASGVVGGAAWGIRFEAAAVVFFFGGGAAEEQK